MYIANKGLRVLKLHINRWTRLITDLKYKLDYINTKTATKSFYKPQTMLKLRSD